MKTLVIALAAQLQVGVPTTNSVAMLREPQPGTSPRNSRAAIDAPAERSPHSPAALDAVPLFFPLAHSLPLPRLGAEFTALGQSTVNFAALDACHEGSLIGLELTDSVAPTLQVDLVERRSHAQYSVFAHVPGRQHSYAILVREHDALAMCVAIDDDLLVYRTRYLSDGVHLILALQPDRQMPCGGSPPATAAPQPSRPLPPMQPEAPDMPSEDEGGGRGSCEREPMKYDIAIVYTGLARVAAGGTNAMNAEVQLAVDLTNIAYANSAIETRSRLVYRGEVVYPETGDASTDLIRLTDDNDGLADVVHTIRDDYRADVVAMWVQNLNACGVAWCSANAGSAFSVTQWECYLTHAHEVGHNQGCNHDADNADSGCEHSWSRGWRFQGSNGGIYRTVMAYSPGARIPHFSNPDILYWNVPTGVPVGEPDEADNARTINGTDTRVRDFRTTRMDVWVDFGFGGFPEIGTFSSPYDTLAEGIPQVLVPVGASELPTLWIKAGNSSETATISRAMVVRPCGGVVRIGG